MVEINLPNRLISVEQASKIEQESRQMFVARLENMQENGDAWITIAAVLALLSDCDRLAIQSNGV